MKNLNFGWLKVIFLLVTIFAFASCGDEDPIGPDPDNPNGNGGDPPVNTAVLPKVGLDLLLEGLETTATLRGWSVLGASDTEVNFEYKLDGTTNWTRVKPVVTNDSSGGKGLSITQVLEMQAKLTNLSPKSRYIYRLVAKNKAGEAISKEQILSTDIVRDYDGNVYQVVKIGDQYWLQQNLSATHFLDGGVIKEMDIFDTSNPCYATPRGIDMKKMSPNIYGLLYSPHCLKSDFIEGFRFPTKEDYQKLLDYCGGGDKAFCALHDATGRYLDKILFGDILEKVDNSSGFTGIPGGLYTMSDGDVPFSNRFVPVGYRHYLWTTSWELDYYFIFQPDLSRLGIFQVNYEAGYSIRLIRK